MLVFLGFNNIGQGWGILALLFGLWVGVAAFPGAISVTNNGGQKLSHYVWVTGRKAAQGFVNQVNVTMAEQL